LKGVGEEVTFKVFSSAFQVLLKHRLHVSTVKSFEAHRRAQRQQRIRRDRPRISFSDFTEKMLTKRQFRKYFRMSRDCFDHLCKAIIGNVGEEVFKSKEYLKDNHGSNIHRAHDVGSSGFLSGETKVALSL